MTAYIGPHGTIYWKVVGEGGTKAGSYHAALPLPDDAPQEAKDLAAQHWTPEVIQASKDRFASARRRRGETQAATDPATGGTAPLPTVTSQADRIDSLEAKIEALLHKIEELSAG